MHYIQGRSSITVKKRHFKIQISERQTMKEASIGCLHSDGGKRSRSQMKEDLANSLGKLVFWQTPTSKQGLNNGEMKSREAR